uniref:ANK_REP_REGION domain-containing protein n=1 Tax=Macrostomum lignano TaxID=282301 RepID=A0A1I8GX36_9PLAT
MTEPRRSDCAICMAEDVEQIRKCLETGSETPDCDCDGQGEPPLLKASRLGRVSVSQVLLEFGAQIDAPCREDSSTALIAAVAGGHLELAQLLIQRGADLNRQRKDGKFALMLAVEAKSFELMKLLLQTKGVKMGLTDIRGKSLLSYAIDANCLKTAQLLIEHGADVNGPYDRARPLLPVSMYMDGREEIFHALLNAGADVNAMDNNGRTALEVAVIKGNREAVKELLQAGSDANRIDSLMDTTCLIEVAVRGFKDIFHDLLTHGARIDLANATGAPELLKELTLLDKDLERMDYSGDTALSNAVKNGHFHAVKVLVEAGAKIGHVNKDGLSCVQIADRNGHTEIKTYLMEKAAEPLEPKELSEQLSEAMERAGFTSERARLQIGLALVLEEMAREMWLDQRHMCGSYAEGWANNIRQVNGTVGKGSDVDWTLLASDGQKFHFEGMCKCADPAGGYCRLEEGHVVVPDA